MQIVGGLRNCQNYRNYVKGLVEFGRGKEQGKIELNITALLQ